jgi:hypothetical protein
MLGQGIRDFSAKYDGQFLKHMRTFDRIIKIKQGVALTVADATKTRLDGLKLTQT